MPSYQRILSAMLLTLATGCTLKSADPLAEPPLTPNAQLTILQTTDVHDHAAGVGHVDATSLAPVGGYPRIATYVDFIRATVGHPVVLVDSGDWSMGTLYDLTLGKQPLALYDMDALRYDCTTLGNHELDYSPLGLAQMLTQAQSSFALRTPLVASNMNVNGNAALAPLFGEKSPIRPSYVETLSNGLRVGYLGLMGKDATIDASATASPVTFDDFSADYALVQKKVDELRNTQGAHVVIALSHSGIEAGAVAGEDVELAKHVKGIDVIASGHTHIPLKRAVAIGNDGWTTQIISASAYGKSVARATLTYHLDSKSTTLDASDNQTMTDANLAALSPTLVADPAYRFIVGQADVELNKALSTLFTTAAGFSDFLEADLSTGLYHPVGRTAQDVIANDQSPVLNPNGLGNLCADAIRAVPNALISKALMAAGWNGSSTDPNLAAIQSQVQANGFDPTFYIASVVATGVIRADLSAGALSFTDIYNVLPLGITPDNLQALPVGYPVMSTYLELGDLKKLCALQLVAQTNLAPSDYYLNLSGISYSLKTTESNTYFKYATAAAALKVTNLKAAAGSSGAQQALAALSTLASDSGRALLDARGAGNPYASALVDLNDVNPDHVTIAANLMVLGQVAAAAGADASAGTSTLTAMIADKAVAAIGDVSAFSTGDPACTNRPSVLLVEGARYRMSADLYAVMMMGAAQAAFGVSITAYKDSTGSDVLSPSNVTAMLPNRVDLDPSTKAIEELKEWMALLLYVETPQSLGGHFTNGQITAEYASTTDFAEFGTYGQAVQVRNASYPLLSIGQLMTTLEDLQLGSK